MNTFFFLAQNRFRYSCKRRLSVTESRQRYKTTCILYFNFYVRCRVVWDQQQVTLRDIGEPVYVYFFSKRARIDTILFPFSGRPNYFRVNNNLHKADRGAIRCHLVPCSLFYEGKPMVLHSQSSRYNGTLLRRICQINVSVEVPTTCSTVLIGELCFRWLVN